MKSISLAAYTGKDIQNVLAVLTQIHTVKKNVKIEEIIQFLNAHIQNSIVYNPEEVPRNIVSPPAHIELEICPSCNKGLLFPTVNFDELNIMSCKKCRYSFIKGEENVK